MHTYIYTYIHRNSCVRILINSCLLVAQLCRSFFPPHYRPQNIHLNCHALSQHLQAYTITLSLFNTCNNNNARMHGNTLHTILKTVPKQAGFTEH